MRHVSRTHRVAFDWLFDRVNLDTKIQIKYIVTKNQLADILIKGNFTRDEWNYFVVLVQYQPFQFYSLLCCNGEAISTRFRRRTSHSEVEANDESCCQDAIVRVVFNFSEPGEETLQKIKIHGNQLLQKIDQGDLIASLQQIFQNWIMTVLGLLKSGKLRLRRTIDQGDLIELLGKWYDKFDLITKKFFSTEPAQSVRYGETLRDRSGRPDNSNSQEVANSQNFIMGSDTPELELSAESRSFVNRVNDQVRKRQKRNFQRCRRRRRTFYYLGNVCGCDDGISDIHGEEFPRQSEFHCEHCRSHTETNVRHICKISGRTR